MLASALRMWLWAAAPWLLSLGAAAEQTAVRLGITREEMDAWSVRSHARAHAAWEAGLHDDVVLEVEGVRRDESIFSMTDGAGA